jgi:hypothetical protein
MGYSYARGSLTIEGLLAPYGRLRGLGCYIVMARCRLLLDWMARSASGLLASDGTLADGLGCYASGTLRALGF